MRMSTGLRILVIRPIADIQCFKRASYKVKDLWQGVC